MEAGKLRKCSVWLLATALFLSLVTFLIGMPYPLAYKIEGVAGNVVDEQTGTPIEGVAVTVAWSAKAGFFVHEHSAGWLGWQYARTDRKGHFSVPGWTWYWREWFSSRDVSDHGPYIALLKSGYVTISTSAPALADQAVYMNRDIRTLAPGYGVIKGFSGLDVSMKKLPPEPKMRYDAFHNVFSFNRFIASERDCYDKDLLDSGFSLQIFDEQVVALKSGLPLPLAEEDKKQMLNGGMSDRAASIFACRLIFKRSINQEF